MGAKQSLEQNPYHKPRRKKIRILIILISICSIFVCLRSTQNWLGDKHVFDHRATLPKLQSTDVIFQQGRWDGALVLEEYKLIFFPIDKVGCSEWKLFFQRSLGYPQWNQKDNFFSLHDPVLNGLKYLANYSEEEAQEMLTSDAWTRAVFVREPKERLLSAFLDKFVNTGLFKDKCCSEASLGSDLEAQRDCIARTNEKDFSYFLKRAVDCPNPHWNAQASSIDLKWWRMMTFVGYMDNASADAEKLLKSLTSSKGTTAWDDYGSSGWGEDGTSAFMTRRSTPHVTGSRDKINMFYSKCDEAFVEKYWAEDWEHDTYHFEKIHLFDDDDLSDCTDMML